MLYWFLCGRKCRTERKLVNSAKRCEKCLIVWISAENGQKCGKVRRMAKTAIPHSPHLNIAPEMERVTSVVDEAIKGGFIMWYSVFIRRVGLWFSSWQSPCLFIRLFGLFFISAVSPTVEYFGFTIRSQRLCTTLVTVGVSLSCVLIVAAGFSTWSWFW